jgi:Transposase
MKTDIANVNRSSAPKKPIVSFPCCPTRGGHREQLDRLWTYKTREGVAQFLHGWLKALRWQRLPEIEKLGDTLVNHFDGIAAYCDHPVRFGVVESLNTTIKGVLRRARGMRDETMLLLKLKWASARPIRSSGDLARFIQPI